MPTELLLTRLENRLEEQTAVTAEAARWAVESWALALSLATDAEIEARNRWVESPPLPKAKTIPLDDLTSSGKIQNVNRTKPAQPPKAQTSNPQSQVKPPQIIRQPTKIPSPLPPVFSPMNKTPAAQPSARTQPINPPTIVKKRFGLFRGCLFMIFLLIISSIVLFLGVPYAIEVMREPQRERNNEPPRFPVR
jgi:outer membrane biosynthesis protein TonB